MKTFDDVIQIVGREFPSARFQVEEFFSGAGQLMVRFADKTWIVEFLPREGYGASLLHNDKSDWLSGHSNLFSSPQQAALWLQKQLLEAKPSFSLAA